MNNKRIENIFWGVVFILIAVSFIVVRLLSFNIFEESYVCKIIVTVLLLAYGIKSFYHWRPVGFILSLAVIGIINVKSLGMESLTTWMILLTSLIVSILFSLLLKRKRNEHFYNKCKKNYMNADELNSNDFSQDFQFDSEDVLDKNKDKISIRTVFDCKVEYITAEKLQKVNLACYFGEVKVYYDSAVILGNIVDMWVNVSFAKIELYIPKNWKVVNNVDRVFAGMYEKVKWEGTGNIVLRISGVADFSDISIIYI